MGSKKKVHTQNIILRFIGEGETPCKVPYFYFYFYDGRCETLLLLPFPFSVKSHLKYASWPLEIFEITVLKKKM